MVSVGDWIDKQWFVHSTEYYLAITRVYQATPKNSQEETGFWLVTFCSWFTGRLHSFAGHTWGVSRDLLVWKEVNQCRSSAGRKAMLNSDFAHSSCYHRVSAVWPGSVCDSWSSRWEEWWVSGPPLLFQMSEGEVTTTGFSLLCCSWSSPVREMVLPLPSLWLTGFPLVAPHPKLWGKWHLTGLTQHSSYSRAMEAM